MTIDHIDAYREVLIVVIERERYRQTDGLTREKMGGNIIISDMKREQKVFDLCIVV